jgi:hypothetical protein
MKRFQTIFFSIAIILIAITGCKKQDITYPSAAINDYLQLQSGKYITYRLDSLLFTNFGTQDTIISYQAMDIVDSQITDNLGRPSWRVNRFLSDTTGTAPWILTETYMVTATRQDYEVVENNLRYIKLVIPIINGYNWSGNSYINTNSPTDPTTEPDFTYLANWSYTYDSVGLPFNTLSGTVANAITIDQRNEFYGDSTDNTVISGLNYSVEAYGKGIGLIYKKLIHWEYQPPNIQDQFGSYSGFGITLNMIDHN